MKTTTAILLLLLTACGPVDDVGPYDAGTEPAYEGGTCERALELCRIDLIDARRDVMNCEAGR